MANDRVYHEPVEVLVLPNAQKARVYHEPVEVLASAVGQKARVYHEPVEVLWKQSTSGSQILNVG